MKLIIPLIFFILSSCIILNSNNPDIMKEKVYTYIDTNFKTTSYLIIESIDNQEFITISGNIVDNKGERIFYKSDKMLVKSDNRNYKFSSNEFVFSKDEINLNQVLGIEKIQSVTDLDIPLKFSYPIHYIWELVKIGIRVISISDIDDSKSLSTIIYNLKP